MLTAFIILGVVLVGVMVAIAAVIIVGIVRDKKSKTPAPEPEPVKKERQPKSLPKPKPQPEAKPEVAEPTVATETAVPAVDDGEEDDRDDEDDVDDGEDNDGITRIRTVVEDGETKYIVIKYSKSFTAKLIQSDAVVKAYYSEIKNRLLAYKGVKSRISWKWETFRSGRVTLAKLRLRGKTLSLCLALDADDYADSKYIVESFASVKAFADTPCVYRIKNDRRLKYSAELIAEVMQKSGIAALETADTADYASQYPYESTDALIDKKLIKVLTEEDAQSGTKFKPSEIRQKVTAQEADSLMRDELAARLLERSEGTTDKTKTAIINIDTLSQYFTDGEVVTLKEIIKRVPSISSKTTYLKVLARGTLDKALTVEADSFSLQAVKMIVLTGGTAIKK